MIIDLTGRRAVVTGSTAGIGRATAEGLARAGASVVVNGSRAQRVATAVDEMREMFPDNEINGVVADLATPEGAVTLFEQAAHADILVNNVGSAWLQPFVDTSDDEWLKIFQLNVLSGIRTTRHYLPSMVERGWGRVIFVSSESAVNIPPDMIHYGTTKTAQLAVSRGVAETVAGTGVTVNAVLPGPTRSELLVDSIAAQAKADGTSPAEAELAMLKNTRPTSLINRLATTDEVANLIVYLSSEQASATTGAALRVDGGIVRFVA